MAARRVDWETRSFAGSLGLLTGILALVVCCLMVLTLGSATILSSVRAYVGGEGLWSRGEKDAVYALRRYAVSRDEADWAAYQAAIAVPLADREAREQLERPNPDFARARAGFLGGRNHPDDVAKLTMLFRTFRHVSYIDRAISIWAEADEEIGRLASLADLLHGLVTQGQTWPGKIDSVLGEIDEANRRLTVLEDRFSFTLGEGARWLESLLRVVVIVSALVLLAGAALLTARVLARIRDSHERYHQLLATARDAFFITDAETGVVLEANRSAAELVGAPVGELIGRRLEDLHPAEERAALRELMAGPTRPGSAESRILTRDGRRVPIEIAVSVTEFGGRRIAASSYRDVSARRAAEQALRDRDEQLRHSQKMEAVGQLAGGVAHDFNNLLTAILGYSSLLLDKLHATDPLRHAAEQVQRAAERAAGLTRQLLAFSRRQVMEPRVLDLNAVVGDTEQMLRRLLGEDIRPHDGARARARPHPRGPDPARTGPHQPGR